MTREFGSQNNGGKPSVTALISAKGGVGLTTAALHWARAIGSRDESCLLLELAGGDLAWMLDNTPEQFAEDVADGRATASQAAVKVAANLDAIVSGNDWAVFGPAASADSERLLAKAADGAWSHWLIDAGVINPSVHTRLFAICDTIAVVMTDELACVSRTYALVRRLAALDLGDKVGLVLNRLKSSAQAKSLTGRFDQITRQFLGRTWPVIGVIPDAAAPVRQKAVHGWSNGPSTDPASPDQSDTQIIETAHVADNTANPGVKTYADQL